MNDYIFAGSMVGVLLWTLLAYCMGRKQGKDHAEVKHEKEKEVIAEAISLKQEAYASKLSRLQGERDNLAHQLLNVLQSPANVRTVSPTAKTEGH